MTAKQAFLKSILKTGEEYAGIILGKNGEPDYHLILIAGETNDVNWTDAKKFAVKSGGELPTRREQSLLFANLKEHFQERAYWSAEQLASSESYAWGLHFFYGYQDNISKYRQLRARAVRRSIINSVI
jgi:hypothetical protein